MVYTVRHNAFVPFCTMVFGIALIAIGLKVAPSVHHIVGFALMLYSAAKIFLPNAVIYYDNKQISITNGLGMAVRFYSMDNAVIEQRGKELFVNGQQVKIIYFLLKSNDIDNMFMYYLGHYRNGYKGNAA